MTSLSLLQGPPNIFVESSVHTGSHLDFAVNFAQMVGLVMMSGKVNFLHILCLFTKVRRLLVSIGSILTGFEVFHLKNLKVI